MMTRRILIALLTLVLCACSSSTTGTSSTAPPRSAAPPTFAPVVAAGAGPCAYVTEAAAHQLGPHTTYPGSTQPHELDFGPSCDYGSAIFTLFSPGYTAAAFAYGATKRVPGIGDHAYYGADYHWLRAEKGRIRFEIRCRLCGDSELAEMTRVARSVVARIP
jgi:hypothetical protein